VHLERTLCGFQKPKPTTKLGFSKFCTFRPKWCVSAGSSGTHAVCVCAMHQNVILLLHAAHIEETFQELIAMAVRDIKNRDCVLQRCSNCPGFGNVHGKLKDMFEDDCEEINFEQWVSVNRTELITQSLLVSEYIQLLLSKLTALTPHHYIAHSQSSYLKKRKEEMNEKSALVLMDFAENYSFHVQDEAQGYHWTHQSCTVHPVVCYYKSSSNELNHLNLCFLSEELQHDTTMVYLIQEKTMQIIKDIVPNLNNVEYFSDGCAAQYKNKSFYNLCMQKQDFGVEATWLFFATSHGKSPCDGIGGTVKRATATENLRQASR